MTQLHSSLLQWNMDFSYGSALVAFLSIPNDGRVQSLADVRHKRRVAYNRARITWNRNRLLRRSSTGRLLLMLERCVILVDQKVEMNSRRLSRLMNDLSYACELADEAGIQNGWIREKSGAYSLVFCVSSGDVVFINLKENLGAEPFFGEPIITNNSWLVARAINEILSQQNNSALRRSTRIAADVAVEINDGGLACAGETVTVNLHGALLRSAAPLKLGDRITLRVSRTAKFAAAAVVFADDTSQQFGVELQQPENIWGVASPPPDWDLPIAN